MAKSADNNLSNILLANWSQGRKTSGLNSNFEIYFSIATPFFAPLGYAHGGASAWSSFSQLVLFLCRNSETISGSVLGAKGSSGDCRLNGGTVTIICRLLRCNAKKLPLLQTRQYQFPNSIIWAMLSQSGCNLQEAWRKIQPNLHPPKTSWTECLFVLQY